MTVRQLTLVRHGESVGNIAATRAQAAGQEVIELGARDADVALSPLGEQQAAALGTRLQSEPVDHLLVSPYRRAQQTADIALAAAGLTPARTVDERLRDRELGVLDLLTWAGVQARFPGEAAARRWLGKFYHRPSGGESWADLGLRIRSVLLELDVRPPVGEHVLVVTHDAVIWLFRYVLQQLSEQDLLAHTVESTVLNGSITRFERTPDGWALTAFNDTDHLQSLGVPITEHSGDADARPR